MHMRSICAIRVRRRMTVMYVASELVKTRLVNKIRTSSEFNKTGLTDMCECRELGKTILTNVVHVSEELRDARLVNDMRASEMHGNAGFINNNICVSIVLGTALQFGCTAMSSTVLFENTVWICIVTAMQGLWLCAVFVRYDMVPLRFCFDPAACLPGG